MPALPPASVMWVRLKHADGTVTVYGHVDSATVQVGQHVMAGDEIAKMGNRGFSTGPHLHFEVWLNGTDKVDPLPWLASRGISLGLGWTDAGTRPSAPTLRYSGAPSPSFNTCGDPSVRRLQLHHRHAADEHQPDLARGAEIDRDCRARADAVGGDHHAEAVLVVTDAITDLEDQVGVVAFGARRGTAIAVGADPGPLGAGPVPASADVVAA